MARKKQSPDAAPPAPAASGPGLPASYQELLEDVKQRISRSRVSAALSVNRELIQLYWEIGRLIVARQAREGWGKSVIDRLAADVQATFPGIQGFSPRNIWHMRSFYLAYSQQVTNLKQAVSELRENLPQAVRDSDGQNLPQAVSEIPWGHNIVLIQKLKDPVERLWYAGKTVEHGWSRAVLVHQIESDLYRRQGQAITNFDQALPAPQSDLARELLKDPYTFDFLGLADAVRERELEDALIDHIQRFLIELGKGFAFVGRQYPLQVGGEDYFVDLLFYHLQLRAFVVIDLKVAPFKPEFAGKMGFYLSAVDDLLRHQHDQPSIGLILCKEQNRVVVEYALRDHTRPLGVATYQLLPDNLKANLPSPEEFEARVRMMDEPQTKGKD